MTDVVLKVFRAPSDALWPLASFVCVGHWRHRWLLRDCTALGSLHGFSACACACAGSLAHVRRLLWDDWLGWRFRGVPQMVSVSTVDRSIFCFNGVGSRPALLSLGLCDKTSHQVWRALFWRHHPLRGWVGPLLFYYSTWPGPVGVVAAPASHFPGLCSLAGAGFGSWEEVFLSFCSSTVVQGCLSFLE